MLTVDLMASFIMIGLVVTAILYLIARMLVVKARGTSDTAKPSKYRQNHNGDMVDSKGRRQGMTADEAHTFWSRRQTNYDDSYDNWQAPY